MELQEQRDEQVWQRKLILVETLITRYSAFSFYLKFASIVTLTIFMLSSYISTNINTIDRVIITALQYCFVLLTLFYLDLYYSNLESKMIEVHERISNQDSRLELKFFYEMAALNFKQNKVKLILENYSFLIYAILFSIYFTYSLLLIFIKRM